MTEIMEIYAQERVRLERELAMVKDVKATVDCVCAGLERMRLQYCDRLEDKKRWSEVERLFDVSRQSVKCMLSATGAGINVLKEEHAQPTMTDRLIALMPISAMAVGAVLTVWLMLEDMNVPAVLAAVLTAIAWLETQVVYRRRLAVAAYSKVDKNELLRMLDRLMESMEYALEMGAQEAAVKETLPGDVERPQLTGGMLEPVQMLMEAVQTKDGDYALKALPGLMAALEEQGIKPVGYSKENEKYFDMYPGTEAGITIRPALLKDGRVIARGQATEAMD